MMRRFAVPAALAIALASCRDAPESVREAPPAGPRVPHVVLRVPVAERSGFVDGAVSPDGRTLAYGVASGEHVRVWSVNLGTGRARLVTPGRGKRVDLVWSPDGSRLAYWDFNRGGIWKLDPRSGREHRVTADPFWSDDYFTLPRWTPNGGLLVNHNDSQSMERIVTPWLLPAGWGKARPLELAGPAPPEAPTFSPDGRRIAFIADGCCGAGRGVALWVRDVRGGEQVCVAGPLPAAMHFPVWAPDGTELYMMLAPPGEKGMWAAYAARAAEGSGARRLGRDSVLSLSVDARGDVYLVTGTRGQGPRPLWRYPRQAVRAGAEAPGEIAGCRPPDARAVRFVEEAGLRDVRGVSELWKDPSRDLVLFRVEYGTEMDWGLWETRTGLRVGGRIGWLDAEQENTGRMIPHPRFDVQPGDGFLFSADFLRAMREIGFEDGWTRFAAGDPDTPPGYPQTAWRAGAGPPPQPK